MGTNHRDALSNDRLLYQLTGQTRAEFNALLPKFEGVYERLVTEAFWSEREHDRVRAAGAGRRGAIPSAAEKLLFILVYQRIYPLLVVQGCLFNMSESRACRWVAVLAPVLDETLGSVGARPARAKGRDLNEVLKACPELAGRNPTECLRLAVIVDGVERPVRRPKDKEKRKTMYSGKKKRFTAKNVTFVSPKQRILAASEERDGSVHDKRVVDDEEMSCSEGVVVHGDRGFQGLKLGDAIVSTPMKLRRRPKGAPKDKLTPQQKVRNARLARRRSPVEHANAGFKRSHVAADVFRGTREGSRERFTSIAMGLHNVRVDYRESYFGEFHSP